MLTRAPYDRLVAEFRWDLPARLNMAAQVCDLWADRDPGRVAIIDLSAGRQEVSYGALQAMSERLALALAERGVARGDRVGVLRSQGAWCAAAHIAIWKIGAISIPLFKLFRHDALTSRVADAGARVVVTDADGVGMLDGLDGVEALVPEADPLPEGRCPTAETGPEDPAVLIYTSGTTGSPKGALHAHRVLAGHLPGVEISHDFLGQPGDCLWTPADWAWIGGLFDVLMPGLALGVPVVAARLAKFGPDDCVRIVRQGSVRNVFFPPTALRMLKASGTRIGGLRSVASGGEPLGVPVVAARLAKFGPDDCARIVWQGSVRNIFFPPTALRMLKASGTRIVGLRSVASGGEPLGAEMLDWGRGAFGLTINEFYGQTECNMVASSCSSLFAPRPGCIGKAVPGHEVEVLDEDGRPAAGEGEVAVRRGSASMMLEYWNRPEATAAKFRGDWMLTGDRGIREGEFLRFIGREDDVITSSGYRIGPAEIEDCLLTHPAVATVGVVGKPDPLRTEIVKAYVVRKHGEDVTEEALQAWVKDRLAGHAYPREIAFLDALPMTVTGKVIRKALRARAEAEAPNG